ncbi:CsbD family protein [Lichenicoccus sp.]|uniref:CsbD family protein n=1 Tax=Lichenicoccus sp. TaxID=2781899 RepID=UPI003D0AB1EA
MADENSVEGLVTQGAGKLKDAAGGLTGDSSLQAEGKFDQLTGKAQRQFGDTLDEAQDQIEGFAGYVADQPLAALGIATGIGFLLGYLLIPARKR